MSQTMKIRQGDTVEVRTGKDRGKRGRVIEALPKQGRVLVENNSKDWPTVTKVTPAKAK